MSNRIVGLDHLPVELLYDIYTCALSPALPLTCKRLYEVFKSAPTTVHAEYLIGCYKEAAARSSNVRAFGFVTCVLRYPLCTREVLEAIFRSSDCPHIPSADDPNRIPTILPRRLFRNLAPREGPGTRPWTGDDEPLPFLRYLYSHERVPKIATNSWDGYALTRAVYAEFVPLIRFLLANEASPECKGKLAVTVAIRRKSLPLVRMLIERDSPSPISEEATSGSKARRRFKVCDGGDGQKAQSQTGASPASASSSGSRSVKRRKLGDRVAVTQEMVKTAVKCDARDIVEYFVKEKGCIPDMQTMLMMSR